MGRRHWHVALVVMTVAIAAAALVWILQTGRSVYADTSSAAGSGGESFVFRLEPDGKGFVFTFTLPADCAGPQDLLVVSNSEQLDVWLAETAVDRIGRLTYTDTNEYEYRAYALAPGSKPLNLITHQGFIWFTAAGADAIGRLDPDTGSVHTFDAGTGSYPADLVAGPNGSVWFTQMMADGLAELVITSTTDYEVRVHTHPLLSGGRPHGIAVTGRSVYVAQTSNDLISIFTPPASWIHMPSAGFPVVLDEPYKLFTDSDGQVWGTERRGNRLGSYAFGTFPDIVHYALSPARSAPTGIAVDAHNDIWFTQHHAGQIGRLRPRASLTERERYYPLPQAGLAPTGIAADGSGAIWVAASRPHRIYLPIVVKRQG